MAGGTRSNGKAYKMGKLSRSGRFGQKKINPTPIVIIACLLLTLIFAIILGNYLGDLAEESKNTTTTVGDPSLIEPPSADKVSPMNSLNAYYADMSGATADESLSNQTSSAREKGNALYLELRDASGALIYSSEKSEELSFATSGDLTLTRLGNHFAYYQDYAVALFKSDFDAKNDAEKRVAIQSSEILLIREATESVFSEIIIEFAGEVTGEDILHYQSYLLSLKLACEGGPVGVKLPISFLGDSDNASEVAGIMNIADFFVVDFGTGDEAEMDARLEGLVYLRSRYDSVILLSDTGERLEERIAHLVEKGVVNYIVK